MVEPDHSQVGWIDDRPAAIDDQLEQGLAKPVFAVPVLYLGTQVLRASAAFSRLKTA
jgi:hypothetical protein